MSLKRRLFGVLVVGFMAAGGPACAGPGSDWPKGTPASSGTSVPTRGEHDTSAQDAGTLDAGGIDAGIDAGVDAPACPPSDAGAPDAASHDAASAVTPDSGCP